ncbi:tyrosine-type recombinase/integrase [Noviherbaspirillum autotrophicum]|uniref:Integrase n=1 Tax=Noviherbaspirillum autotrophicum TaxID=709839 RepID=A0A0C2BWN3_9BURK|nr:integrase arm-type DNA-binding domain-containing protein [Noviherbaspirillum autotrophicum]KIF82411.1 integrase [Noviherbaspirillum autotrophicum]
MPKLVVPLTDAQIKNAKPKDRTYKLFDGGGLYLEVMPTGSKLWRMKFKQANGKEGRLSFGSYPEVSLTAARAKRVEARELKAKDIDPGEVRRLEKLQRAAAASNTFEAVARQWHANKREVWKENTAKDAMNRLEKDVFPLIGKRPIAEIDAPVMLDVLRRVEQRGAKEIAARLGQLCSQIFRYAIASGLAKYNPVPDLRGALKPRVKGHHAAISTDELPEFLRVLEKNEARMYTPTRILMRLMMLVFVRTSELIETPWSEIDLEDEQWVIPWQRMKMGKRKVNPRKVNHHVNMPRQGWEMLRELHAITGRGKYLFPNQRDHEKPVSNGAILAALKRMGYGGKHTGHGFRALAMGVIKECLGYRHDVVNRQLAHMSGDAYGEAYDRAEFLEERRAMMQQYADYLASIASGNIAIGWPAKAA